uniref:hypothetical protein n=1 Tax=Roseivirga sp. TaxID=1964215 RepID=UPI0040574E09
MKVSATLFLIIVIQSVVFGQKRKVVEDPEIVFSYELPRGWAIFDDDYYLYLIPPSQYREENFSITYLETNAQAVEEQFNAALNNFYPLNEPGFKVIESGDETVRELKAKWAVFDSKVDNVEFRSYLFFFIENGQIFKLRGTARLKNFDKYKANFLKICKSIESRSK